MSIEAVLGRAEKNQSESLDRLFELLKIPSISTDPEYAGECHKAAEWLTATLTDLGFEAAVRETDGNPMVLAHWTSKFADPDLPSVLFYGHYDVQPVDPLDLWDSPPFDPQLHTVDGRQQIWARGACDDKGQLMTFLEACRFWIEETGDLPVSVTVLLEGEEESGSTNLEPFLAAHKDELNGDIVLVCDTGMWDIETPAITIMLRGLVGEEITVKAASRDLHSGLYGNAAQNPNHVLARILADLRDSEGRVMVPDFYDGIEELPAEVSSQWANLDFDAAGFLGDIGLSLPGGEKDRTVLEQTWSRPSCEINGMVGGYTGDGFKTVIPAEASAKISFRLVVGQDPDKIRSNFREFVNARIPSDCEVVFEEHGGSPGVALDTTSSFLKTAQKSLNDEFQKDAILVGSGGSIPIVEIFKNQLSMDSLLVGFGLDDDRVHSPNEKYELSSFRSATRFWARLLDDLTK